MNLATIEADSNRIQETLRLELAKAESQYKHARMMQDAKWWPIQLIELALGLTPGMRYNRMRKKAYSKAYSQLDDLLAAAAAYRKGR